MNRSMETVFSAPVLGYGLATLIAIPVMALTSGTVLSWLLFIWLAGAPMTLIVAGIKMSILAHRERNSAVKNKHNRHTQSLHKT